MEALNASGNSAAGFCRLAVGGIAKKTLTEGCRKGHMGILRDDSRKGQSCGVHHVVDGQAHRAQHTLVHPVDDEADVFLAHQL